MALTWTGQGWELGLRSARCWESCRGAWEPEAWPCSPLTWVLLAPAPTSWLPGQHEAGGSGQEDSFLHPSGQRGGCGRSQDKGACWSLGAEPVSRLCAGLLLPFPTHCQLQRQTVWRSVEAHSVEDGGSQCLAPGVEHSLVLQFSSTCQLGGLQTSSGRCLEV